MIHEAKPQISMCLYHTPLKKQLSAFPSSLNNCKAYFFKYSSLLLLMHCYVSWHVTTTNAARVLVHVQCAQVPYDKKQTHWITVLLSTAPQGTSNFRIPILLHRQKSKSNQSGLS